MNLQLKIQFLKYRFQNQVIQSQYGFTIIECLIAIIVVGLLLVSIAPVLVLSTATRVQAKRVEQAAQAAHTFIDALRTKEIALPNADTTTLSTPTNTSPRRIGDNLMTTTTMPIPTSSDGLYCYNQNGTITNGKYKNDGTAKSPAVTSFTCDLFYIQAAQITSSQSNSGNRVAIRIYRADGFDNTISTPTPYQSLTAGLNGTTAAHTFTGGLGNRQAPLIELTTDISSTNTSFSSLCQHFGGCTPATPTATSTATASP